ncbi:MAG: ABC transporter ATP-binding protein [Gammaproteobacteria bacterium]
MNEAEAKPKTGAEISGYGGGGVAANISTEKVNEEARALSEGRDLDFAALRALAGGGEFLTMSGVRAGYGKIEILHGLDLCLGRGQALCLVGPNGAGKSTVLHAVYGLANVLAGEIKLDGRNIGGLAPEKKLAAGAAYILQDNSIFPDMTVEENLLMGGYVLPSADEARESAERIFAKYNRLAERRNQKAGSLSGGERRLLEISRALITNPSLLLVDEPSIGLEPRYIDMVFEILSDLRDAEGKTVLMVEQNAKKGLAFADIGYVLAAGNLALAGAGAELLENPAVGRLFLGG